MEEKTKLEVRLNKVQVERAEDVLGSLGLSLSEAVSMFLVQVLLQNGLPFVVNLPGRDDREIMDQVYDYLHSDLDDNDDMAPHEDQLSLDDGIFADYEETTNNLSSTAEEV